MFQPEHGQKMWWTKGNQTILWRVDGDSNFGNIGSQRGIRPGSEGSLTFSVIPKEDGPLTVNCQLEAIPRPKSGSEEAMETAAQLLRGHLLFTYKYEYNDGEKTATKIGIAEITDGSFLVTLPNAQANVPQEVTLKWFWPFLLREATTRADYDDDENNKVINEYTPHYYRDTDEAATIYYCAYEDHDGSWAEGVSELGINGRDTDSYTIQTAALYDVSALSNAASATTLQCTITLERKKDDSAYETVDIINRHLSKADVSVRYTEGNTLRDLEKLDARGRDLTFDVKGFSPDVPIQIPITLGVRTGGDFERSSLTYANYRVKVTAELYNGETSLKGSTATDYIVYTNAKIYQGLVSTDTQQN